MALKKKTKKMMSWVVVQLIEFSVFAVLLTLLNLYFGVAFLNSIAVRLFGALIMTAMIKIGSIEAKIFR